MADILRYNVCYSKCEWGVWQLT